MAKVFVTRQIPGDSLSHFLGASYEVVVSEFDRPLTQPELISKVSGIDALLSLLTDKVDASVMDACGPNLKVISNYAVGFDNIDVKAASERGIVVTNTPSDEVNESVAEHTLALLFSLSRRIVEADEVTRKGAYKGWEPGIFLGNIISKKTLGVIGLGRIGEMVAVRARALGMRVLYNKRSPDPEAEARTGAVFCDIGKLLAESDYVSLHVPLTPETRHMMNSGLFAQMKQGAYLINTARGAIVNEADLVTFLRNGHIAGAGLDVFDNEPSINAELVGMENVILTPHIASATYEARRKMGDQAVSAILDVMSDKKPENIVDPSVWEKRRK